MKKLYTVQALWDSEANVWMAEGVDVPGLCTEATTWEKLIKKLDVMVPEMLEANGLLKSGKNTEIPYKLIGECVSIAHIH